MKVLIRYSEISLKGQNRSFFEKKLRDNIKKYFDSENISYGKIQKEDSRFVTEVEKSKKVVEALSKIIGIKSFSFVETSKRTQKSLLDTCGKLLKSFDKSVETIAVVSKRSDKNFELNSNQINNLIGNLAVDKGFKINLNNPDKTIYVEITSSNAYVYSEKMGGVSGLPVGSAGKLLCLFSGGIDSCVASWLMMKRGARVDFLHFHALRNNEDVLKSKILKLIQTLNKNQFSSKLYVIPYVDYQLFMSDKVPPNLDVIVFRNFMARLAQRICLSKGYKGIITGDSLGQVASQTLDNLLATNYGINVSVFRPLISFDKEECVDLARKIGTFEKSITAYKDCCSIISRKPSISCKTEELKEIFSKIDLKKLEDNSLEKMDTFNI